MGRHRLALVIDEDPQSRADVQTALKSAPVAIAGDCGYGVEASSLAEELQPELVLAAVEEPADRALQTLRSVRDLLPGSQIIVYSSLNDMNVMRQAMQIGVRDFLPRPLDMDDLTAAIESMEDPELERVEEPRRQQAAGVVLTVFGAKGGIGKSTIATNIAAVVAKHTNLSVLLMDMDTRFGDIAIMMDIQPRHTVADLAGLGEGLDRETFRSALMPHESGAFVLAAPKHPSEWRSISPEQMKALIEYGARMFDYVILDTPGTFNDIVATAIEVATRVVVVSSLDMASIKDTAYMLDLLDGEGYPAERLLLTVNDVSRMNSLKSRDIPQIVKHEVFWTIPYDKEVLRAGEVGQPVVLAKPRSRAAKQLLGLAEKIVGAGAFERQRPPGGGLRRKVLSFLPLRAAAALF